MDDRNDGIDMRSDFDRELDDMADIISKHGDDIIDRDDSNNRRQRRANRYDDDDMDSYSVQKRKRRASRYDDTDDDDDDDDDIAVHGTFSQRVGRACVNYWKNAFDFSNRTSKFDYWAAAITYGIIMQMFNISYFFNESTIIYLISVLLSRHVYSFAFYGRTPPSRHRSIGIRHLFRTHPHRWSVHLALFFATKRRIRQPPSPRLNITAKPRVECNMSRSHSLRPHCARRRLNESPITPSNTSEFAHTRCLLRKQIAFGIFST